MSDGGGRYHRESGWEAARFNWENAVMSFFGAIAVGICPLFC